MPAVVTVGAKNGQLPNERQLSGDQLQERPVQRIKCNRPMSTVHHLCPFLLLSFSLPALLYLFLFLSFHLCHSYTDPLRESVRSPPGNGHEIAIVDDMENRAGTESRKGEKRKGEEGRGEGRRRERGKRTQTHTHRHIHTRVSSFSFRSSRLVNIRGRGVLEIGVRHEIEGSVASNMLGRINEVVARRRLRK